MRTSSKTTKEKYLEALREMHTALRYTDQFSMDAFCKEKKISKGIPKVLSSGGVIKNTGTQGRGARWIWISKEPDMAMVDELVVRLGRETSQVYRDKRKQKPTKKSNSIFDVPDTSRVSKYTPKKNKSTEFSFFWGMIKFKKQ